MHCSIFGISTLVAAATLFQVGVWEDDDDHGGGRDIIFECTAYFTACDPPDDESCFYTGRDPNEEVARMEALNECKFDNPRRGRYCMVESCEEIPRPRPDAR